MGYSHTEVQCNYSFFTPQFKGIAKKINLDDITPMLTNGVALSRNNTVRLQIFKDSANGYYSDTYGWYPNIEGGSWSLNGSVKHPDTVEFSAGEGFLVINKVRVKKNTSTGIEEETGTGSQWRPIHFLHSGEVVLDQPTVVPCNYSFAGNNGFGTVNLDQLVPTLTNGVALSRNNTVRIQLFKDAANGYYTDTYGWYPNIEGGSWSLNGTVKHPDTVEFKPGEGYVIINKVRVKKNTSTGIEEETGTGSQWRPILMTVLQKDK